MWCLLNGRAMFLHPVPGPIQDVKLCAQSTLRGQQDQRGWGETAASVCGRQRGDGQVDHWLFVMGPLEINPKICARKVYWGVLSGTAAWGGMKDARQRPQLIPQGTLISGWPSELSHLEAKETRILNSPTYLSLDARCLGMGVGTWLWWPENSNWAESCQPSRAGEMSVSV